MAILQGIRVIELTHMVAGPSCGQVLGDLGADVVKVEPPGGDITRRLGPENAGGSALFATANRNKRSIQLDLRDPADAATARRLAGHADVLVSNLDHRMLADAGLAPEALRAAYPALIVAEITAFGPGGPLGTDGIAQAAMGLMHLTGAADGEGFRTGASIVDVSTGIWAALGVLAALERRRQTGRGDRLAVNLADTCLYMQYSQIGLFQADPSVVRRNGNHSMVSCTPIFQAADGRVMTTILHDRHWAELCRMVERPDLIERPAFADNDARCRAQPEIERELNPAFAERDRTHWVALLRGARIPCAPERSYAEIVADETLRRDGMLFDLPAEGEGHLQVRMPLRFSEQPEPPARPAPAAGGTDATALLAEWAGGNG